MSRETIKSLNDVLHLFRYNLEKEISVNDTLKKILDYKKVLLEKIPATEWRGTPWDAGIIQKKINDTLAPYTKDYTNVGSATLTGVKIVSLASGAGKLFYPSINELCDVRLENSYMYGVRLNNCSALRIEDSTIAPVMDPPRYCTIFMDTEIWVLDSCESGKRGSVKTGNFLLSIYKPFEKTYTTNVICTEEE